MFRNYSDIFRHIQNLIKHLQISLLQKLLQLQLFPQIKIIFPVHSCQFCEIGIRETISRGHTMVATEREKFEFQGL